MRDRLVNAVLLGLYQTSVLFGILLLPVALLARRAGVTLPVHRLLRRCEEAYESHS